MTTANGILDASAVNEIVAGGFTPRKQTIVPVGDSYTARTSTITSTQAVFNNHAHFNWFQIYTGFQFEFLNNAGVDGQRTDQIYARLDSDVFAYDPAWVMDVSGLNDIIQNVAEATIITNKTLMVEAYLKKNVRPILATIPPSDANTTTVTAAQMIKRQNINRWIRRLPFIYPGVIVADIERVLIDATSTSGYAKANVLANAGGADSGVHLTTWGAQLAGKCLADAVASAVRIVDDGPVSAAFTYDVNSSSKNIAMNPLFLSSGGTAGTGASGTIAQGMTIGSTAGTPTSVCTLDARSDGFGNDQSAAITAGASGDIVRLRQTGLLTRASVGDVLRAAVSVKLESAVNVKAVWLHLEGQTSATYREARIGSIQSGINTAYIKALDNFSGRLKTANVPLSDGVSIASIAWNVYVEFMGAGSATVRIGRASVDK